MHKIYSLDHTRTSVLFPLSHTSSHACARTTMYVHIYPPPQRTRRRRSKLKMTTTLVFDQSTLVPAGCTHICMCKHTHTHIPEYYGRSRASLYEGWFVFASLGRVVSAMDSAKNNPNVFPASATASPLFFRDSILGSTTRDAFTECPKSADYYNTSR